jgi:1,4-alpha-glucan branching enzyme
VRFRLRAAGALAVSLVGSWDDWQAPGRVVVATREAGLFEVWMDLPEGTYRYHFMVDGQPRRPPEAPRYTPDGFGDEDGVLDVPQPQAGTASRPAPDAVGGPR